MTSIIGASGYPRTYIDPGFANQTDLITTGRTTASIKAIILFIIAIALLIGGIYLIDKAVRLNQTTSGTVSNCTCFTILPLRANDPITYSCTFDVLYKASQNSEPQKINATTNDSLRHYNGQTIDVYYDPNDTSYASIYADNSHLFGWVCIAMGVIIAFGTSLHLFAVYRYDSVAAKEGLDDLVGNVQSTVYAPGGAFPPGGAVLASSAPLGGAPVYI